MSAPDSPTPPSSPPERQPEEGAKRRYIKAQPEGAPDNIRFQPQVAWTDGEFPGWLNIGEPTISKRNAKERVRLYCDTHKEVKPEDIRYLRVVSESVVVDIDSPDIAPPPGRPRETETPRTDVMHDMLAPEHSPEYCYDSMIRHARTLERECARLQQALQRAEGELSAARTNLQSASERDATNHTYFLNVLHAVGKAGFVGSLTSLHKLTLDEIASLRASLQTANQKLAEAERDGKEWAFKVVQKMHDDYCQNAESGMTDPDTGERMFNRQEGAYVEMLEDVMTELRSRIDAARAPDAGEKTTP